MSSGLAFAAAGSGSFGGLVVMFERNAECMLVGNLGGGGGHPSHKLVLSATFVVHFCIVASGAIWVLLSFRKHF